MLCPVNRRISQFGHTVIIQVLASQGEAVRSILTCFTNKQYKKDGRKSEIFMTKVMYVLVSFIIFSKDEIHRLILDKSIDNILLKMKG